MHNGSTISGKGVKEADGKSGEVPGKALEISEDAFAAGRTASTTDSPKDGPSAATGGSSDVAPNVASGTSDDASLGDSPAITGKLSSLGAGKTPDVPIRGGPLLRMILSNVKEA